MNNGIAQCGIGILGCILVAISGFSDGKIGVGLLGIAGVVALVVLLWAYRRHQLRKAR